VHRAVISHSAGPASPMMTPMPYAVTLEFSSEQAVNRGRPLANSLLTFQHEPPGMSSCQTGKIRRQVLTSSLLRVRDQLDLVSNVVRLYGSVSMILPPASEQLRDALSPRIADFQALNALHGIAASESKERIPAPCCPALEASERLSSANNGAVLTPPAPDREQRG
jgi:hypothetical protein